MTLSGAYLAESLYAVLEHYLGLEAYIKWFTRGSALNNFSEQRVVRQCAIIVVCTVNVLCNCSVRWHEKKCLEDLIEKKYHLCDSSYSMLRRIVP